ncbi:hypothetical protein [Tateyamaria sp. 1078]|uniref:hypothetical protein n=1 Tax=Tateyamaria sp. 1078 TaxID=3417464 RepID=UPI003EBD80F9
MPTLFASAGEMPTPFASAAEMPTPFASAAEMPRRSGLTERQSFVYHAYNAIFLLR